MQITIDHDKLREAAQELHENGYEDVPVDVLTGVVEKWVVLEIDDLITDLSYHIDKGFTAFNRLLRAEQAQRARLGLPVSDGDIPPSDWD